MYSIYGTIDNTIVLLDVVTAPDAEWAVIIARHNFPSVVNTIFALPCLHYEDAA